jgi:hypothetical protein
MAVGGAWGECVALRNVLGGGEGTEVTAAFLDVLAGRQKPEEGG